MAFSKKALKARAALRRNSSKCGYREVLEQGEKAFRSGAVNPFKPGTEDHEIWQEGWDDAREMAA